MKKAMKRLAGFLGVILFCAMFFPLTVMADETVEMPENMMLIEAAFAPDGEYGNIVIENGTSGRFSYEVPACSWTDGYGAKHTISEFHVEGTAYISNGEDGDKIEFDYTSGYIPIPKGNYYGYMDSSNQEVTYTVVHEYEDFIRTEEKVFTIDRGHFFSTRNFDGEINPFEFFIPYHGTAIYTDVFASGETERHENQINSEEGFKIVLKPINFIDPFLAQGGSKDVNEESKTENVTKGSTASDDTDFADPLTTLVISVLAILLSILFGNTGGFIPTVPAGADLGRWLRFDGDGDIETTDPVNGQKRTFVHNGDGTYTDPVSGATYTPEELSEQMEHRAGNAGTIRQDEERFHRNVTEDSQRNQERSDESKQLEEDLQHERQGRAHREKVERVATELGMSGASEDEVRQELARRMERDEDFRQKMNDYAQRRDIAVDTLEYTVDAADYAMAAGEALGGAPGKVISATYKGIKNIGATVAEKGLSTGSVIEGAIKGGTEAASTMMNAGVGKAGVTFGGTVAGEIAEAVNDGEDVTRATMEGFVKGTVNVASGAVGDAYGDMVGGDSLLNKAAETAGKIGETGFGKDAAEPLYDKMINKDE